MDESLSSRMSLLLQKQQASEINDAERAELKMLMEIFELGQLRKAQALVESVRRGLREPLTPRAFRKLCENAYRRHLMVGVLTV